MNNQQSLVEVVQAHCDDLDRCIPTLREYGLTETAKEAEKAIAELRAALEAQLKPQDELPELPEGEEAGYMCMSSKIYTADQMRAYGQLCASLAAQPDPQKQRDICDQCTTIHECMQACFCQQTGKEMVELLRPTDAQPAPALSDEQAELISLLRGLRPEFGDVGSRDVDVRAKQQKIDRAIATLQAAQPVQGEQK